MAKKAIRPIRIEGNVAYVPLTKGYEAIIDAADVPLVEGTHWQAQIPRRKDGSIYTVYAVTTDFSSGRPRKVFMHRIIASTQNGMNTDHVDGNGLNNLRENLRWATNAQNAHNNRRPIRNTSGVKGVSWYKAKRKWHAQIQNEGERIHIGFFSNVEDAAVAVAEVRARLQGEFCRP